MESGFFRAQKSGINVLAILARLGDRKAAVQAIVGRLSGLAAEPREIYLNALLTLAGLRGLEVAVEQEVKRVPILNNILDHKVLGREYKKGIKEGIERGLEQGLEQGRQRGIEQGIEQGRQREALKLLHGLLEKRFGVLPSWAEERLAARSLRELEDLTPRVLDVKSIEELLQ